MPYPNDDETPNDYTYGNETTLDPDDNDLVPDNPVEEEIDWNDNDEPDEDDD